MTETLPPRCARCAFFHRTGSTDRVGNAPGECRYDPPIHKNGPRNCWPEVWGTAWCGRFTERARRLDNANEGAEQ